MYQHVLNTFHIYSATMSDADYVCSLDEKSIKKAKEELGEDPKERLGAVQSFREWILQQKHIKCDTGMNEECSYYYLNHHVRLKNVSSAKTEEYYLNN